MKNRCMMYDHVFVMFFPRSDQNGLNQTVYEPRHEKTNDCICENKDADQLRGNHEADQRLCFRYIDSTIPLLSKYEILSL